MRFFRPQPFPSRTSYRRRFIPSAPETGVSQNFILGIESKTNPSVDKVGLIEALTLATVDKQVGLEAIGSVLADFIPGLESKTNPSVDKVGLIESLTLATIDKQILLEAIISASVSKIPLIEALQGIYDSDVINLEAGTTASAVDVDKIIGIEALTSPSVSRASAIEALTSPSVSHTSALEALVDARTSVTQNVESLFGLLKSVAMLYEAKAAPLSLPIAVVRKSSPTATGTDDITSDNLGGVTPDGTLRFFTKAITDGAEASHAQLSISFSDGTLSRTIAGKSEDNQTTVSETGRIHTSDAALITNDDSHTTNGVASFSSYISDGETLNWTDALSTALLGHYVFFTGSDAHVATQTPNSTDTETDITAPGHLPSCVFVIFNDRDVDAGGANRNLSSFGVAINGVQRSVLWDDADNRATTETYGMYSTNYVAGEAGATGGKLEASNFDANGFSITERLSGVSQFSYCSLSFSGKTTKLIDVASPTSTGDQVITGLGIQPDFVMYGLCMVDTADTAVTDGSIFPVGVYITDGVDEYTVWMRIVDNVTTTDCASFSDDRFYLPNQSGTSKFIGSISSLDTDGWTMNWSQVDSGTNYKWWALAVGSQVSSVSQNFLPNLESSSGVFSSSAGGLEALVSALSEFFGNIESPTSAEAGHASNIEGLAGATASHNQNIEGLISLLNSFTAQHESGVTPLGDFAANVEAKARAAASRTSGIEALSSVTGSNTPLLESMQTIYGPSVLYYESQGIAAIEGDLFIEYESLGNVAGDQAAEFEAKGRLTADRDLSLESLQNISGQLIQTYEVKTTLARQITPQIESLISVLQQRTVLHEAIQGIRSGAALLFESLGVPLIAADFATGLESLKTLYAGRTVSGEAKTSLTWATTPPYEINQSVAGDTSIGFEALHIVSPDQGVAIEALGRVLNTLSPDIEAIESVLATSTQVIEAIKTEYGVKVVNFEATDFTFPAVVISMVNLDGVDNYVITLDGRDNYIVPLDGKLN